MHHNPHRPLIMIKMHVVQTESLFPQRGNGLSHQEQVNSILESISNDGELVSVTHNVCATAEDGITNAITSTFILYKD